MNPSAPSRFDRSTQDIGNIVEFGHVNIAVPDQQLAIVFYVMGLGLTRDPYLRVGIDNAWINVGTNQFHLPTGAAQVLRGCVGLVVPQLERVAASLAAVEPLLEGTLFAVERHDAQIDVRCPWGNRIRVHAPDPARFGRLQLGMPYVELDTPPGTAAGIARFYAEVLGAPGRVTEDGGGVIASIPVGLYEHLLFRETRATIPPHDGHHIQITVADFSGVHRRLVERGLVTEESNESQYRFEAITDLDTGAVITTLEHEVRSMRHPLFARPQINRNPANRELGTP
jgi:catechol 2,3-dioxygenase-like lactoylglutathione lyase family enzyme